MNSAAPVSANPKVSSDGRKVGDEPRDVNSLKVAMSSIFDNLEDEDAKEVFKAVVGSIDKTVGGQQKRTNEMKNTNSSVKKPQQQKSTVSPLQKMIRESVKNYLTEIDPNRWSYSGPDTYGERDDEHEGPKRKNIVASEDGADEGEKMAELGDIAKELGISVSGAKAAVQKALARVRALLIDIPLADQEIMVLRALGDYIEYLESSGELESDEVTMLRANPALVRELDGFREFLGDYVKDEMKKAGSQMQLGNAPGEELFFSQRRDKFVIVSIAQTSPSSNVENNVRGSYQLIAEAASKGARFIAFPELAFAAARPKDKRYAATCSQTLDGWMTEIVKKSSCRFNAYVGFGYVELKKGEFFNSYAIVSPDGSVFNFTKNSFSPRDAQWVSDRIDIVPSNASCVLPELGRVGVIFEGEILSYSQGSVDLLVFPSREFVTAFPPADPFVAAFASGARVVMFANTVTKNSNGGSFVVVDGKPWTYGSSFTSEAIIGAIT